jgi:hypothetical protein
MRWTLFLILTGLLLLGIGLAGAQQQAKAGEAEYQQGHVYGWQLMNEQERHEYQQQMRELKTEREREAYRQLHHERMQERARQQGVTLPDTPGGPHGKGISPGSGDRKRGGK